MDAFEREEREIERMESEGEIDSHEARKLLNELYRDYHACAQESAQQAYDDEMARW
jgi:hypothetical protein